MAVHDHAVGRDEPEPLVRMDPLTRGSLFHKVQAEFFRALEARGALIVTTATLKAAAVTLDEVLDLADVVVTIFAGRIVSIVPRAEASAPRILADMTTSHSGGGAT